MISIDRFLAIRFPFRDLKYIKVALSLCLLIWVVAVCVSGVEYWTQVYQQKYPPPLIPPRGEVNAADAFDIGSFDEEDTKGLKLTEADQELYKNFPLVISERWQNEVRPQVRRIVFTV